MMDILETAKLDSAGLKRPFEHSGSGAPRPNVMQALHCDERGEHALEVLMILTFGVMPMISAVWLLEDVLREYVAFGQIYLSSPFF